MASDLNASPEQRAQDLLATMTIEEKAQQVVGLLPTGLLGPAGVIASTASKLLAEGIGHVGMLGTFGHLVPERLAKATNQIQHYLLTKTRLGIPATFHIEALNGPVAPGFPVHPTAIALAATWNPDAVKEMAALTGRQVRAVGHGHVLSPVMDVARDARWGRVHETYGEEPYLVTALSVAYTRGLQGAGPLEGAIATGKHFLGYAVTEAGQNMAKTVLGRRELFEVYARPFEAAIRLAGLRSVMNSYASIDGVPLGASHEYLTEMLRGDFGFTGTVVSDYDTIGQLVSRVGVAKDAQEAGRLALAAGIDMELPNSYGYGRTLAAAVRSGEVPAEQLDQAAWRVLRDKFALGVFDRPYVDEDPVVINAIAKEGSEPGGLAHRLAQQSVTLLKNEGRLPLTRDLKRIAVVGPHADNVSVAFPPYTFPAGLEMLGARFRGERSNVPGTENMVTEMPPEAIELMRQDLGGPLSQSIDEYIRERYGSVSLADAIRAAVPGAVVTVARGCGVLDEEPADIREAVAAARDADVVVLALGGRAGWFIPQITEGEGCDTADIDLPANQVALVQAVAATGTPAVGVVFTGRPMALTEIIDELPAVVYGYYGGQHGSTAVAEVLFGDVNPSGKLPVSIPRHSGQVPVYSGQPMGTGYRRAAYDMHQGYLDMSASPLFPFGHGLSYTSFAYCDLTITPSEVPAAGSVTIDMTVRNDGDRAGTEIVQVYFADRATGVTRPSQELVGFARVELEPGETAGVTLTVELAQLAYLGLDGRLVLEPGPIEVLVGSSSDDIRLRGQVEITGEAAVFEHREVFLSEAAVRRSSPTPVTEAAMS
ncbi:beta-glucosidase [Parafrankia soli]|uniref:Exo-alpha-(1->6)-L-arabinopyranosidase n=1 Tax=Parafrankia soli TaxID=2599596 RepID=A0A1S1PCC6_9ACTN|nr:glycoside hydrolase family 3 N-terminal domain-containing protein [Parafrankia soli]OHV18911.1 beta-glucosidase [Parafrankia soli]